MKIVFTCSILFLFLLFPLKTFANSTNQFITIVNPVRISSYTKDPAASITAEYDEIRKRNLSATWLLTYDVISRENIASAIREFDKNQELGIFMEITPQFTEQAQVLYKKTDSWHRANSLFLSGYPQEDRKKLIDTIFLKFKETFGFYPTSVGSWWNDSFSLEYMKEKYGITANLTCADQFETDGYHLWGQYWSTPFYPSKNHAGIPAKDADSKLDLVTIQWAPRDPLNGYYSSRFSMQDYFTLGLGIDYFEKLIKLYAQKNRNDFGQITLGLEGDLSADAYQGIYAQQMEIVSKFIDNGDYQINTMQQFSAWYRSEYKDLTPDFLIESDDLLGKAQKVIWYQSPNYRMGMVYDLKEIKLTVIDFRTYLSGFVEPYYLTPNFQIDLFINIPSVIDSISNTQSKWEIANVKLKTIKNSDSGYQIEFENNKVIKLAKDSIIFDGFGENLKAPSILKNSPKLNFKETNNSLIIYPKAVYLYENEGLLFHDLSIKATYFFWRPKIHLISTVVAGIILLVTVVCFFIKKKPIYKLKILGTIYAPFLIVFLILRLTNDQIYYVNQAETDALEHLAALPYGKVIVFEDGCLICKWQTKHPPPAFAGKKSYVGKLSHKPIVYNSTVFEAKSRVDGKRELAKLGVKYIYLVKYEGYIEEMPFSPGDLNVEKIYENANTQIWQVKTT